MAAWLANVFKTSWGVVREQVRTARALDEMPATRSAVEADEVSMCSVRSLVAARDADPTAFAVTEDRWWMQRASARWATSVA